MILYFFGSKECDNCLLLKELLEYIAKKLKAQGITTIKYVDVMEDDQQSLCDEHNVDIVPRVKLYNDDELVFDREGLFDIEELHNTLKELKK